MKHKKILPLFLTATFALAPQFLGAISWIGGTDSNNLPDNNNWDPAGAPGSNEVGVFDTVSNPPVLLSADSYALGQADITVDGFEMTVYGDLTLNDVASATGTTSNIFVEADGSLTMNGALATDGVVNYYINGGDFTYNGSTGSATSNIFLQNGSTFTVSSPLTITSLGSSSLSNTVALDAALTLSGSDTQLIAGSFNGSGALNIEGGAFLTFTGTSTNTGSVSVTGGTFSMKGSMADVTGVTLSSATLKGTGTLGPVTLSGSCVVAPGASIGTLTVSSIVFPSSSVFQVEIDPTSASLLNVIGSATLDGTVEVVQDSGNYARTATYQILNAGSLSGEFTSVSGGISGYAFSLTQEGKTVYLSYEVSLIDTASLTGNRLDVANYLNTSSSNSTLLLVNGLEGSALTTALDAISPARNAFGTYIVEQNAFALNSLLASHMDTKRSFLKERNPDIAALLVDAKEGPTGNFNAPDGKNSTWALGFGELAHQSSSDQNPAFHYAVGGALVGFDRTLGEEGSAGFALGYSRSYFHDNNHMGSGHINSYFASLYGNAPIGDFYFAPAIWGVFNETHNVRNISFTGVSEQAKANIFAWQLVPHLEAGYRFKMGFGVINPYTSADWSIIWQRGYEEHGSSFNMDQKRNNSSMVRSETGLKFLEQWKKSWGAFILKEQVAYVFEKPYGTGTVNASLVGTPSSFTVTAVDKNLNLAFVGLDFICSIGKRNPLQVDLGVKGEFGSSYQLGELVLDISKKF